MPPIKQVPLSREQIREAKVSSNFGYLYDENPLMALYGANAEKQLLSEVDTCLFKCRKFGEEMVNDLAARFKLKVSGTGLHETLTVLDRNDYLTPEAVRALRYIQRHGNEAVHGYFNDREVAFRSVYVCFQLGDLYYRLLNETAPARIFVAPEDGKRKEETGNTEKVMMRSSSASGRIFAEAVLERLAIEAPKPAPAVQLLRRGKRYFGPYRIAGRIVGGGVGQVFRAYNEQTQRYVALKLLPDNILAYKSLEERFASDAVVVSILDHSNIVKVFDWGNIGGRSFIEMELVEGRTLEDVLSTGPLSPHRAVNIVKQIASALEAAHAAGVTHRDVKPLNILIGSDDHAYLLDFGIAQLLNWPTNVKVVGSVEYTAPEGIRGIVHATHRHQLDIYSLTCVLYECLAGMAPYRGDDDQIRNQHFSAAAPRLSVAESGSTIGLDDVIARGMDKDPQGRYASAGDLARAAESALYSTRALPSCDANVDIAGESSHDEPGLPRPRRTELTRKVSPRREIPRVPAKRRPGDASDHQGIPWDALLWLFGPTVAVGMSMLVMYLTRDRVGKALGIPYWASEMIRGHLGADVIVWTGLGVAGLLTLLVVFFGVGQFPERGTRALIEHKRFVLPCFAVLLSIPWSLVPGHLALEHAHDQWKIAEWGDWHRALTYVTAISIYTFVSLIVALSLADAMVRVRRFLIAAASVMIIEGIVDILLFTHIVSPR